MDQNVIPFDLHRMFLGEQPMLFYAEILVRTLLIYAYTLLMIRWIGGRGVAQLSLVEFVLVIALGSAVGDAMFYPEVPLLVAMLVITAVVAMNKGLDWLILRSDLAKDNIDGRPVQLVLDGHLVLAGLQITEMGPAEVKAMLREHGVRNLGEVEHAFLESSGRLSLFRASQPRPGLPLIPPDSVQPALPVHPALLDPAFAPDGEACCANCGALEDAHVALPQGLCGHCGGHHWVAPRTDRCGKDMP